MKRIYLASLVPILSSVALFSTVTWAEFGYSQKPIKRPNRAAPPKFKPADYDGVFFADALAQLQGDRPTPGSQASGKLGSNAMANSATAKSDVENAPESSNSSWKSLISGSSIEDLIKEARLRIDGLVTTPAKFAAGGVIEARKEFTLLATLMAIIQEYPEDIRWKHSAPYGRMIFARMASNCKVGTQPVFNEAKLRTQDLNELLKGSKLSGQAEAISWDETSDRTPAMKILEWALRENLSKLTASEKEFQQSKEEVKKYAELVAAYGLVLQQQGMSDSDDETYIELSQSMTEAASMVVTATIAGDAESARVAVGKIDQSCNKCHESYR
ncbi:cytochrome c [Pirellulaceae bacterium SH449]